MHPKKFRLFNDDPGAVGGGAAPAPAPAASAPAPAAPAASPAAGPAPAPAPAASALTTGGAPDWTPEAIPEKLRVMGEDGQLDQGATLRKVEEHRSNLEKRMGSGEIRPKTADDYKLEGEQFQKLGLDAAATADFRKEAHDLNLSQAQFEGVMARYARLAPELVTAAKVQTTEEVLGTLRQTWPDAATFKTNMQGAHRAAEALAQKAGMTSQEVEEAIGNNPAAIRLLAALGPEMGEDRAPASASGGTAVNAPADLNTFLQQGDNWPAYSDPKHIRHAAVTAEAHRITQAAAKRTG